MSEEKQFAKSKFLNLEEVQELVNEYMQIKLHDMKAGTAFVAKITGPIEEKAIEGYDNVFQMPIAYKNKDLAEPAVLTLQAGESAVKRLQEKFPDDSYVDKYCVFSKTSYNGKFPQFINPMKGEPIDQKSKDDVFKKKEGVKDKKMDFSVFDDFVSDYKATMGETGRKPDVVHMMGAYIATFEADKYAELQKKCEEALK